MISLAGMARISGVPADVLDFRQHLVQQMGSALALQLIFHVQDERCRYLVLENFGLNPDGLIDKFAVPRTDVRNMLFDAIQPLHVQT